MNACVIGASGRLGTLITEYLLENGVKVNALVRTLNKCKFKDKINKIANGSALEESVLKEAMTNCDIIFSVLGEKTFWKPFTTLSDSARLQLNVMNELGIRRWIGIGHGLLLEHEDAGQDRFTPLWPMLLKGTNVILLVTDSTVENVIQTKRAFIKLIQKARPEAIVIGIANKQDLPKAMSAPLVKKVLGVDEVYSICAIDPSERKKLKQIIGLGIEKYLKKKEEEDKMLG